MYIRLIKRINSIIIAILLSLAYVIIIMPYSLFLSKRNGLWHERQHVYSEIDTKYM